MTWNTFRRRLWSDRVLWSSPGVLRVLLCCDRCRRVVPFWRMVGVMPRPVGCVCGCSKVWPSNVPQWRAAYWLLVRGWLVRKLLCRLPDWDPRMPLREGPLPQ